MKSYETTSGQRSIVLETAEGISAAIYSFRRLRQAVSNGEHRTSDSAVERLRDRYRLKALEDSTHYGYSRLAMACFARQQPLEGQIGAFCIAGNRNLAFLSEGAEMALRERRGEIEPSKQDSEKAIDSLLVRDGEGYEEALESFSRLGMQTISLT